MDNKDLGHSLRDGLSPSVEPASSLAGSAASIPSAVARWSDRLMGVMAVLDSWGDLSPSDRNQEIWRINAEVSDIIAEMALDCDSDTRRMAETGTGSERSSGSAGLGEASPNSTPENQHNG